MDRRLGALYYFTTILTHSGGRLHCIHISNQKRCLHVMAVALSPSVLLLRLLRHSACFLLALWAEYLVAETCQRLR